MTRPSIRAREPGDDAAIAAVTTAAFGGPDEAKLIEALRRDGDMVCEFVAIDAGETVGHIAFSCLDVRADPRSLRAVALAPLAVAPGRQSQGVGDALAHHALTHLRNDGWDLAIVLGHPTYYPRFGFSPLLAKLFDAPYSGPSFMALELKPGVVGALRWAVAYPRAFASGTG
jgi:putative acetyltransferase